MFNSIDHFFAQRVQFSITKVKNEYKNNQFKGRVYRKIEAKSIEFSSTKSVHKSDSDKLLNTDRFNPRKSQIEVCNLDEEVDSEEDMKSILAPTSARNLHKSSISSKKSKIEDK